MNSNSFQLKKPVTKFSRKIFCNRFCDKKIETKKKSQFLLQKISIENFVTEIFRAANFYN